MTYTATVSIDDADLFILPREDDRIVFHLGDALATSGVHHLGQYTATIFKDGVQVDSVSVPNHWWNAEWTWRPATLQIVRTHAQLIAANFSFPFGNTGCPVNQVSNSVYSGPMSSADVTIYEPTTGERPWIGWCTDASGLFMLGGATGPMLNVAQVAGSCPLHFRDKTTGLPINLIQYPQANAYDLPGKQGVPFILKGETDPQASQYNVFDGGWTPQKAHFTDFSFHACMATQDAGFLEDLQAEATFCVCADASGSTPAGAIISGETRGIAWSLGMVFKAHVATMDFEARGKLPASCFPSSYFKKLLDQSLAYYSKVAADPNNQTFRLINEFARFSPWTVDYLLTALAFGVLTGHSDWAPLYLWCLGNVIARTNGTSGYAPGLGTNYRFNTVAGGQDASLPRLTWAQAFDALVGDPEAGAGITQAQHDALVANPLNGGVAMNGNEYMMTTRAALVMADYVDKKGLAAVRAAYPDFGISLTNAERMFQAYGQVNARVSVVSDLSASPVILPPLPPVVLPVNPPKETPPPMTDNVDALAPLASAVHAATALKDRVIARLNAIVAAATNTGTQVDPAELTSLVAELQGDNAALNTALPPT